MWRLNAWQELARRPLRPTISPSQPLSGSHIRPPRCAGYGTFHTTTAMHCPRYALIRSRAWVQTAMPERQGGRLCTWHAGEHAGQAGSLQLLHGLLHLHHGLDVLRVQRLLQRCRIAQSFPAQTLVLCLDEASMQSRCCAACCHLEVAQHASTKPEGPGFAALSSVQWMGHLVLLMHQNECGAS